VKPKLDARRIHKNCTSVAIAKRHLGLIKQQYDANADKQDFAIVKNQYGRSLTVALLLHDCRHLVPSLHMETAAGDHSDIVCGSIDYGHLRRS